MQEGRVASGNLSDRSAMFADALASSRPVGRGPRFRPPSRGVPANLGLTVDGMSCRARSPIVSAAHIELFATNRVVVIPAGIGVAPPLLTLGAYVRRGRCVYPLRTLDPTGLVLLGPGGKRTLGTLFKVWGQPLSRSIVAGFRAPVHSGVSVFIDGVPWRADPAMAPLAPHSQITIEVGSHVPPHARYVFPSLAWANS